MLWSFPKLAPFWILKSQFSLILHSFSRPKFLKNLLSRTTKGANFQNHQRAPYPICIFFGPKDSKSAPAPFPAQWEDPPQNLTPPCELVLMIKTTKKVTSNRKCWSNTLAGWAEGNYKWAASCEAGQVLVEEEKCGGKCWKETNDFSHNDCMSWKWIIIGGSNANDDDCNRGILNLSSHSCLLLLLLAIKAFGQIVNAFKWHDCINYKAFIPTETDLNHFIKENSGPFCTFIYTVNRVVSGKITQLTKVQWWWWWW